MTLTFESMTLSDLHPGDILHSLAGITFTPPRPSSHTLVTAETAFGDTTAQVHTSHAIFTVAPSALVTFSRVDSTPTILIGRRTSLHATVLGFGAPVSRYTPVADDDTAPHVTADAWNDAQTILIDGFLSQETIRAMWNREEFTPEGKQIIMLGDDLDDSRIYGRSRAAFAGGIAMLPDHAAGLAQLLQHIAEGHPVTL